MRSTAVEMGKESGLRSQSLAATRQRSAPVHRLHHPQNSTNVQGFTLLEVILALALLAGAMAMLGELCRLGLRNAQEARDLTRCEMVCDSIVSQIVAGAMATSAVSGAAWDEDPRWLYTVDTQTTNQAGLIQLHVTVARDLPPEKHPVQCTIYRWMVDPGLEQAEAAQAQSAAENSTTNSSSNSSSSNSSSTSSGTGTSTNSGGAQ
jgi:general secretion pathway protein I